MAEFFDTSLSDLLAAKIEYERAQAGQRLAGTQTQAQDFSTAPLPQNPQAKAASYTATPGGMDKRLLIGGGIAAAVLLFVALRKKKRK